MSRRREPQETSDAGPVRRILFIHSAGAQSATEGSGRFLARLGEALGPGYEICAPAMPGPDAPEAGPWLDTAARHAAAMQTPFVLLGHSLGGSVILKLLAERTIPTGLAGVVTVAAPFWGAPEWEYEAFALPANAGTTLSKGPPVMLLFATEDTVVSTDHLDRYLAAVPTARGRLIGGDHEFGAGDMESVVAALHSLIE